MKKSIIIFTLSTLFAGSFFIACNTTPNEKLEMASDKVDEVKTDMINEKDEFLFEVDSFKKDINDMIDRNNKNIADYKVRMENERKEIRDENIKKINEIEQKNIELKKSLDAYQADNRESWKTFKEEFYSDMKGLETALDNLFKDNKK